MIDFNLDLPVEISEPEAAYNVNRELNLAWDIVEETGANLFLTGRAGTGKTTFLKKLREVSSKRMIVLAPTGVAAINASGSTIHSFFQLPFAPYIPGKGFLSADRKFLKISRQKKRLISSLSLLVIDEISMVRPDILDAIDSFLRKMRSSSLPFGGLQLLLIGDLRQLPPVVKDREWEILKEHYASPYFFESHALKKAGFQTVELSMVYRQSDTDFIHILNSIRDGKATTETLSRLNRCYRPGFNPENSEGYIRLTTHNRNAASINESKLNALPGQLHTFEASVEGEFPESSFPVEQHLRLKEGTQVMFVKNDTGNARRFYNGLIGTVTEITGEKIYVLPIGGTQEIEVEKAEWENTRYVVDEHNKAIAQECIGIFRQYPLQPAWAITIHKSQGLTFDRAIIDATHSFAPGQTYVALSRCRSLEGLVLDAPIPPRAVIIDQDVNAFIEYCESTAPDSTKILSLKNDYLFSLLSELFDFEPLRRSFSDFDRYVREYLVPLYPEIEPKMIEFTDKISDSLCAIGKRFLHSYYGVRIDEELSSSVSNFSSRIRNGCEYFLETVEDLQTFLGRLPRQMNNREYTTRLNNTFDNLKYHVDLKQMLLSYHSAADFSVKEYLDAKARAVLAIEKGLPAKKPRKKAAPSPTKRTSHHSPR